MRTQKEHKQLTQITPADISFLDSMAPEWQGIV